jgi:hypothetical protein
MAAAARAQPAGKVPTIGFLGADAEGWRPWTDAFVGQLRKLGWIEGGTIAIEYRRSQARPERAPRSRPSLFASGGKKPYASTHATGDGEITGPKCGACLASASFCASRAQSISTAVQWSVTELRPLRVKAPKKL